MDELLKESFDKRQQEAEERIKATENENKQLKERLEITQAVVDEIALGGAL